MTILSLSLAAVGVFIFRWLRYRVSLPPGPRGFPIIGNILTLPKEYEWIHWSKHKTIYGAFTLSCDVDYY